MTAAHCSNGLEMLQAASIKLAASTPPTAPTAPTAPIPTIAGAPAPQTSAGPSAPGGTAPLSALLNPAPMDAPVPLPPGFVLGKDGTLKKKRGRKPAPGLTDEDRRQARLLKNRRTAEISRRRKLALLNSLTAERDLAKAHAFRLRKHNQFLTERLARALGLSVDALFKQEAECVPPPDCASAASEDQSDVSRAVSCVDSDSDNSIKKT